MLVLFGPGLLKDSGEIDRDILEFLVREIKEQAKTTPSLFSWECEIDALSPDDPKAILPEEVALAEQIAQSETCTFASSLEQQLPSDDLTGLVRQLRTSVIAGEVYRGVFPEDQVPSEYKPEAYGEGVCKTLEDSLLGSVRDNPLSKREAMREVLSPSVSRDATPDSGPVHRVARAAIGRGIDEDSHDECELVSRRRDEPLGKQDKTIGFNRTRVDKAFFEDWFVLGKPVAREQIRIVATRGQGEAGIEKALKELGDRKDEEARVLRATYEKMLNVLKRDQPFLHASGLRKLFLIVLQKPRMDSQEL